MKKDLKILFLEDVPQDVELVERMLHKANISFTGRRVDCRDTFIEALGAFTPDIVLSDHTLPQFDSFSALKIVQENCPDTPFILVTGSVSEEFAAASIKSGADDYILKTNLSRLPGALRNALTKKELLVENGIIRQLNKKLNIANEEIEKKNVDIMASIRYAKRIQDAMLPEKKYLERIFPGSFIIYEPKAIVSGDFYWFAECQDKLIIAVADCTGHGVPGAFMSVTGIHLLNYLVNNKKILQPSEILERMNKYIQKAFKQHNADSESKDGMDVGICAIDKKNNTLEYAGANRPLYFYNYNNYYLRVINGDKKPVGGTADRKVIYTNHKINIHPQDNIFLFTDGYADQFGGTKNKKLMSRRFKDLLTKIQHLEMNEQEKMLRDFIPFWKGNNEQLDDILLIGIKI